MNVTVLGFLRRETTTRPDGQGGFGVGGSALYTAAALARSGVTTDVITWIPPSDAELLSAFADYPVNLHVLETASDTIAPTDFNDDMRVALEHSNLVHLGPERASTISLATLQYLSNDLGVKLSADLSPYLTAPDAEGQLLPTAFWRERAAYLNYFDTVFMSTKDIQGFLAAGESVLSVARMMSEGGPGEIVITLGAEGSFVYQRETNEGFSVPAYPPKRLVDPRGVGATYFGAFLASRFASENSLQAARYAAMAASLKLNYTGPLREAGEDIERKVTEAEEKNPQ